MKSRLLGGVAKHEAMFHRDPRRPSGLHVDLSRGRISTSRRNRKGIPMADHGMFYWNEFLSTDVEAAKTFFADTLGWTYTAMDMGAMTYWVAKQGDKTVGGLMPMPSNMPDGTPSHWMSYIAVDDVDARVEKAKAAGGTILSEPFNVPDVGRIAILQDASGGTIGWITPPA